MNRKSFLKSLLAIAIAPKVLQNIKSTAIEFKPPYLSKTFSLGWTVRKSDIDNCMYGKVTSLNDAMNKALMKHQRDINEAYAKKIMDWDDLEYLDYITNA